MLSQRKDFGNSPESFSFDTERETIIMRVLFINETCGLISHGRVCVNLARQMQNEGHICKIAYGRLTEVSEDSRDLAVRIGTPVSMYLHGVLTRIFDRHGFGSYLATKKFLKWTESFNPDMIWLHNIHGYYIHAGLLFKWIKNHPSIQVKWTLHDCWAFTGHCAHYMAVKCDKWKSGCNHCPEKKQYPASWLMDNSKSNYAKKKKCFSHVQNMQLITPSQWLADQTKESFLNQYPVSVIHNDIDHDVFRPISFLLSDEKRRIEELKDKYLIPSDKQIVLGVASKWTMKKGMDDFIKMNTRLDHQKQVLVMVGLNEKQLKTIPDTIIGICRTENRQELARIYSLSDVYVNLTYEENYPTVNLEAEACGTDVLTYDAGGCRETIHREGSRVFPVGDLDMVVEELKRRIV